MLKIYHINNKVKTEVQPYDGIYNVFELGLYEFAYFNEIVSNRVFLEDVPIEDSKLQVDANSIYLQEFRYFEDYFGYAGIKINNEIFHFNIRIEKLKLSEIEEIFLFLWEKEEKLFNVFFSKSTYELKFDQKGFEIGETSKFLTYAIHFLDVFEKLHPFFLKAPHTVLRENRVVVPFSEDTISVNSLHYLINNLDEIRFDNTNTGHSESFKIANRYGLIDNIEGILNYNSYDTYENQIILGAFDHIKRKIALLKSNIQSNVDVSNISNGEYVEFKDLKRIPFIKLFQDSTSIENRLNKIYQRYKLLFRNVRSRREKPKLTAVFSKKSQYQKAYMLIRDLTSYKFNLNGEYRLLNINKLSTLYEIYNLFQLVDSIKSILNIGLFSLTASSNRGDEIIDRVEFANASVKITLFYELQYFVDSPKEQHTLLRRISAALGGIYYKPDYIIEIWEMQTGNKDYLILDSKYTKFETVKTKHLSDSVYKYLLNTGIKGLPSSKISGLYLLFPGDQMHQLIEDKSFEPCIACIPSKPNTLNFVGTVLHSFFSKKIKPKFIAGFINDESES